ncbi:neprilysin-1-like isoform X2 [Fopius arisanus]|uniref:Neprilysin-1-like isoform X2 n=1 Tax=Fopius arisanus TaxID=64838 RepID=A0A9R1TSQ6_9HYME|nr:PREDICTED: neprilysin-1-like isoform X2 [Fopius arisanus]
MLESPVEDTDIYPIQKAKKLYQSCVSSDLSPMAFMMESLIEENGGWPMLLDFEAWKEDEHSWQEIDLNVARSTGEYAFFGIDFIPIPGGDPEDQNIYLNTPEEETLPLEENEEEYYSGVKRLLTSFFGERKINVSVEQLRKDIHNLYIFEKALQEVTVPEEWQWMHVMNLKQWIGDWYFRNKLQPNPKTKIKWMKVLGNVIKNNDSQITFHWQVNVARPYYLALPEIWRKTTKRTIVNYVYLKFVRKNLQNNKRQGMVSRWLDCFQRTEMFDVNVYWLVERNFGPNYQIYIQKLLQNVKTELIYQINNSRWMEDKFKENFTKKLETIQFSYTYPREYKNLSVIKENSKRNIYEPETSDNCHIYKRLIVSSLTSKVSYSYNENTVYIPVLLFQPSTISFDIPQYIHYATIGYVINEGIGRVLKFTGITQRADNTLTFYNRRPFNHYLRNANCIWQRIEDHLELKVMTFQDMNELISSTFGLRASLRAFKRAGQDQNATWVPNFKLSQFEEYTDEQMFFITFAAISEFGRVFNCPVDSPMNPVDKCSI